MEHPVKALVLAPFSAEALRAMGTLMPVTRESWTETRRLYDPHELAQRINDEQIVALIIEADFLFEEVFQEAHPLRFVGVCRASLNHVDLEAATAHGVVVVHTPGRTAQAVAELTVGLLLALARRIPQAHQYVKEAHWEDPVEPYIALRGVELSGRILGVIGLGATGRRVARLGRGLGMHVVAYDPYAGPLGSRRAGATLVDLDHLLSQSDCVTIHTPDTPETEGLLDAQRLARMKPGSYLINVASPSVVEPKALVHALREGRLAGAALDVHESHPIPPSHPFLALDNLLLTPHLGGATDGTVERHSRAIVEDLQRFLQGRRPRRLANPEVWRRRGR